MCWMFAGRRDPVMARSTRPDNLRVVDGKGRNPGVRCMAVFANRAG